MTQKLLLIERADPAVFYGPSGSNIQALKRLYPSMRFVARGHAIKAYGDESDMGGLEDLVRRMDLLASQRGQLDEQDVLRLHAGEAPAPVAPADDLIIHGVGGKPITARTPGQRALVEAFARHDLVFAVGPAGTGKTYAAIALAVRALKNKEVRRIILSRPAVEAGEKLGFLPGEMKDKLDPYLQPLYDALGDMLPAARLQSLMESGVIQIAPLAYMRGRTLSEAVIILDEAQNTTGPQLKMFLTRLGMGSHMIVTGDMSQVDLPRGVPSGLTQARHILAGVPGIATITFAATDIVRHRLVSRIVEAYDRHEQELKARRDQERAAGAPAPLRPRDQEPDGGQGVSKN